ncbi:MAG: hypothetical protein RH917_13495 [Lacipirellulaceae bacterium]
MDTAALLLLVSSLGANLGWQPATDGSAGYEVLIQVDQRQVDRLELSAQQSELLQRKLPAKLPADISPIRSVRLISQADDLPRIRRMVALKPIVPEQTERLPRDGIKLTQFNGPVPGSGGGARYSNSDAANFDPYAKPSATTQPTTRNPFQPQNTLAEEARKAGQNLTQFSQEQLRQLQNQAASGVENVTNDARRTVNDALRDAQAGIPQVQAQDLFGGQPRTATGTRGATRPLDRVTQPLREGVDRLGDRTQQLFDNLGRPIRRLTGRDEAPQPNPLRSNTPNNGYPANDPRYAQPSSDSRFPAQQQPGNLQLDNRRFESGQPDPRGVDPRLLAERDANGFRAVRGERIDMPIDSREVGRWPQETQYNDSLSERDRRRAEDTYWTRTADERDLRSDRWRQDRLASNDRATDGGRYPSPDRYDSKQNDWPQYDQEDLANRRNDARFVRTGDSRADRGAAWEEGPTLADPNFDSRNLDARSSESWNSDSKVPELRKGMGDVFASNEQQRDPFSVPREFANQPGTDYRSGNENNRQYDLSRQNPQLTNVTNRTESEKQDMVSAILAWVLFSGSLAGNFYLWWSYLDVRSKYSHIVRESRSLGRNYSPV